VQEKHIKRRGNVAMEETYERDFNKNGPRILKKKVIAPENSKIQTKTFFPPFPFLLPEARNRKIQPEILKSNKKLFSALPIPPSLFLFHQP
jgi:hypothetical protein